MVVKASAMQAESMGHCQLNRMQLMCSQQVFHVTLRNVRFSARTVCRGWKTPGRAAKRTLCATGTATSGAELQGRKYSSRVQYATRLATTADFWAIAEVHAQSFYPNADWLFGPLLRLDRVCALQMAIDADVKQGQGRFACLLAHDLDAADVSSLSEPVFGAFPGANVPPFFKFLLAKHLQVGFSLSPERLGLLGAVVVDMQGQHLPPERVEKGTFLGYKPQEGVAYISNLAVSPAVRRMGVGEELLKAAEKVAMDWGCKTICLHCDPLNQAASGLYKKNGYAGVRTQMNWLSWAGGPPRLQLMQKTVT